MRPNTLTRNWFRVSQRLGLGPQTGLEYWERRARLLGPDAVINTALEDGEGIAAVQRQKLLPAFQRRLTGDEGLIVDFGCGAGRLTGALAAIAGCEVLGVDPIPALLEAAPHDDVRVRYELLEDGRVPLADGAADAVFICEVLGGVPDGAAIERTAAELDRVLAPGGFIVFAECESGTARALHWTDRSPEEYAKLFEFLEVSSVDSYDDGGHNVVVMVGRREPAT